jgi:hypothetical protein
VADDPLSAALESLKHDHRQIVSEHYPAPGACLACRGPWPCQEYRAAAALDTVLKLADDWDAEAREIWAQVTEDMGATVAGFKAIGATDRQEHARALREAVTRELTGEAQGG